MGKSSLLLFANGFLIVCFFSISCVRFLTHFLLLLTFLTSYIFIFEFLSDKIAANDTLEQRNQAKTSADYIENLMNLYDILLHLFLACTLHTFVILLNIYLRKF
jgi:hypothetical protein